MRSINASMDHYAILGVSRRASGTEIKQAFRKKAKEYHPDTSRRLDAVDQFKLLVKAYTVLKNKKTRDEYNYELMADYFQEHVVDPARKRFSGYGYSSDVSEDDWGLRVG